MIVDPHLTYDVVFPLSNRAATLEELRLVYVRRTLGRILINYPHLADSAAIGDHEGVGQPPVGTGAANRVDSSARRSHEDAVQLGGAVEVVHPKVGAGVGGGRAAAAAPAAPALAAAATHPAATQQAAQDGASAATCTEKKLLFDPDGVSKTWRSIFPPPHAPFSCLVKLPRGY